MKKKQMSIRSQFAQNLPPELIMDFAAICKHFPELSPEECLLHVFSRGIEAVMFEIVSDE